MWAKITLISITILLLTVSYIVVVNIYAESTLDTTKEKKTGENIVGISDTISIHIEKHRWYGTIKQENNIEFVYLFNQIRIPTKKENTHFGIIHSIFLVVLLIIITVGCLFLKKEPPKNRKVYIKKMV